MLTGYPLDGSIIEAIPKSSSLSKLANFEISDSEFFLLNFSSSSSSELLI